MGFLDNQNNKLITNIFTKYNLNYSKLNQRLNDELNEQIPGNNYSPYNLPNENNNVNNYDISELALRTQEEEDIKQSLSGVSKERLTPGEVETILRSWCFYMVDHFLNKQNNQSNPRKGGFLFGGRKKSKKS